ncbi:hypothetical protein XFEB_01591 [Xylella fastidiosa EB92.1]|nr:hypothetical protein XFEB_01591 [Xylella fastidiosa EB92.1]
MDDLEGHLNVESMENKSALYRCPLKSQQSQHLGTNHKSVVSMLQLQKKASGERVHEVQVSSTNTLVKTLVSRTEAIDDIRSVLQASGVTGASLRLGDGGHAPGY